MTEDKFPKEKGAKKFSDDKPDYSNIQKSFMDELSRALKEGETRYGRNNWMKGRPWYDWWAAALRHLFKAKDVGKYDPESKDKRIRHLAEAAANIMFLIHQEDTSTDPQQRNPV